MSNPVQKDERFYGRKSGKALRQSQKLLFAELYPKLEITLENYTPSNLLGRIFEDLSIQEIWLEIGFGGGEHLAELAEQNPHIGFIGCEPFINGVAKLLQKIDEKGLKNIRIFKDDCKKLLKITPYDTFSKVFLMFPDPWPKARHKERRFVCPENLATLSRVLKPSGEFRTASDEAGLIEWTKDAMKDQSLFQWVLPKSDQEFLKPEGWPQSRYEQKAIRAGRQPVYFSFINNKKSVS